ncbi:ABC transporter substrate-binding protein [Kitasatospora sp. A2-31]|uniref:RsiG family protein n=1 Tax=Kitasatospora sp. A2-31 TaxID=2916414 RepID=UPI001EEB97F9|nr:ABC transporter substrate-binding protein [Kitasatospora sp. A2-31]MCG6495016.1 ABC transporter substrate-binding protein [Kitasatospora sp. A2-31]
MDASSAEQDRYGRAPGGAEPAGDFAAPVRPGDVPGPPAGRAPADGPAADRAADRAAEPDLEGLGLDQLRTLRRETLEQEADLSYLRRLLHGRMDILRAELDRRPGSSVLVPAGAEGAPAGALLDRLPAILTDAPSTVRRSARHVTVGPPRGLQSQVEADALMGDVQLADLAAHPAEELLAALDRLRAHEREVSGRRQLLLRTADGCSAEITRRYRDGEARVDDLLAGGPL